MHMLHKNYSLCVNITPAYDQISKIRGKSELRHELKFHICEAQLVRRWCVSCRWFRVQPIGWGMPPLYVYTLAVGRVTV